MSENRSWMAGVALGATLVSGSPEAASAQVGQATASLDVGLRIVSALSVRGVKDLDFGEVVASSAGTTRDVHKADPNAGQFEVVGADGQGVQVSFVAPSTLIRENGPGAMLVDIAVYAAPTPAAGGAEPVLPEGTVVLSHGRYYLFVAGSITVRDIGANPAGTYSGEFQLSVAYTTL